MNTETLFYQNYKEPLKTVTEVLGEGYGYMGTIATTLDKNLVQCHICGSLFEKLNVHVRLTHNLTASEYKTKFGLAQRTALIGERVRENLSDANYEQFKKMNAKRSEALKKYWQEVREGKRKHVRMKSYKRSLENKNINGNCPDQLLDKIKRLKEKLGRTPTSNEFSKLSGSNAHTIRTTFGSWGEALKLLGLTEGKPGIAPTHTKASVIAAIQDFTKDHGRVPRKSDLERGFICSHSTMRHLFKGGLVEAREKAGVGQVVQVSATEWIDESKLAWVK